MAQSRKIDRSDILSIMALLMSMGAVFVAMKQTSILKEQQKIMASQQEGSVWPHLDIHASVTQDSVSSTLNISLRNNGIGPAIVKKFDLDANHDPKFDFQRLDELLTSLDISTIHGLSFTHPVDKTIPPGEEVNILNLKTGDPETNYMLMFDLIKKFNLKSFCYESVYKIKYGDGCN